MLQEAQLHDKQISDMQVRMALWGGSLEGQRPHFWGGGQVGRQCWLAATGYLVLAWA